MSQDLAALAAAPKSLAGIVGGLWGAIDFAQPQKAGFRPQVGALQSNPGSDAARSPVLPAPITKQSDYIEPPAFDRDLVITADASLHNRSDLLHSLGLSSLSDLPDTELLLAAYRKWGTACADFLLGEFAFAIWDKRLQRLFCCRDHLGIRSFLYWRHQTRFVFASDIDPIIERGGAPRILNRRKLAALSVPTAHFAQHEETFHAGIMSLPAGTWMTVDSKGLRQQRYWEPKAGENAEFQGRPKEALEKLREILIQAVDCRLDPDRPVASTLSGGLDSSAIVAIAARRLAEKNRQLTAIAGVLPDDMLTRFQDERVFINEFQCWPNIEIKYVTASNRGPFDALNDLSRFKILPTRSSRFYLTEECEKAALAGGVRTLLCGFGGELGPTSWSERYYLELALRLRFPTLFREFAKRRTGRNSSPARTLARQLLTAFFPVRNVPPFVFLSKDFQRECRDKPAWGGHWFTQRRYQIENLRFWMRKHALGRGQRVSLIPQTYPLLDKRVLEFCLSLPASFDIRDGYQRYLIRGALDGLLPPKIQWRTDKMAFSSDYFVRYNAQLGIARDYAAEIRPNDPVRSVIDVDRLSSELKPVDPVAGSSLARDQIPATLYTISFLRQFPDFQA